MSYLVLARKWRPQNFEEVIGQAHITKTLMNAISSNRVGHAFLLSGPRGVGKTSIARIFAKALNCEEGPTKTPCNICTLCREISGGISADVLEIDGASNTGVDDIRGIRENISYLPNKSRHKIYIIDEVHMLSTSAFNALLKTLEEPPKHVIFIFATTEPHKIPNTILSRCQRFDFKRITLQDLALHMKKIISEEGVNISEGSLLLIAKEARGSMRDAQSFLDQVISFGGKEIDDNGVIEVLGLIDRKLLYDTSLAILEKDSRRCLELIDNIYNFGYNLEQFYQELVEHLRNLIVMKIDQRSGQLINLPENEILELKEQADKISQEDLQQLFNILVSSENELKRTTSPKLIFEMTLIRMTQLDSLLSINEILTRMVRLEERLSKHQTDISPDLIPTEETIVPSSGTSHEKEYPPKHSSSSEVEDNSTSEQEYPPSHLSEETWKELISHLKKSEPLLPSQLEQGKILKIDGDEIFLGFENTFLMEMVKDKIEKSRIRDILQSFFKKAVKITFSTFASDSISEDDLPAKDIDSREKAALLRKEAVENPIIRSALNIFGGEIAEIKTDIGWIKNPKY